MAGGKKGNRRPTAENGRLTFSAVALYNGKMIIVSSGTSAQRIGGAGTAQCVDIRGDVPVVKKTRGGCQNAIPLRLINERRKNVLLIVIPQELSALIFLLSAWSDHPIFQSDSPLTHENNPQFESIG